VQNSGTKLDFAGKISGNNSGKNLDDYT